MDGRIPTGQKRLATGAGGIARPIGTAMRGDPNFKSIGMVTSDTLNIVNRPATKQEHGLVGLRTKTQTHERQIYDRNYYLTQLVNKSNEMAREIEKFTKQAEEITKDNQAFFQMEKKYETLTKEVRKLEGELADYNLTFDKLRAGARPEDILNMYEHVRMSNERLRAQLDEFFIERKTQEDQINAFEAQLNEIHQAAELKINELDPDQRADYESMINENRQLIANINAQRAELEELNQILGQADAKLRMDDKKQKYKILKEQVTTLEKKKEELEIQTNENNLSFPEARDRLLARVKDDNNIIKNIDKKIMDVRKTIENYEKQLKDMRMDLEEKKSEEQDKQKYEVLYQRDREMTEFIENYEENRRNEMQGINRTQHSIVEALEQASKILLMNTELPNKDQYLQLQNELDHKKTHQENAEVTLQRLKIEYEQRANEIKNFDQFEERMTTEANSLKERLAKMDDEIKNKFNRINDYRRESEEKRTKLLRNKEALAQQLQKAKEELNTVNLDHERRKQKLNLHDQYKNLSGLEKTFGQNEGQICNLRTFIKSRAVDMDYKNLINECNSMTESLNKMLLAGGK